jgi:putative ABC transport system permease protein
MMMWLRRILGGFNALFRKRQVERDLDDELRAYLEASIGDRIRAGMTRDDATRAATIEMGSFEAVKDQTRDAGWEAGLESIWQDVRHAVRTLRRSPGFSVVAILTLALGIGANTAIFQLADAVRLRPLPVEHPEQLVEVRMADPTRGRSGTFSGRRPLFTHALWEKLQQHREAFSGVVAWGAYPVNVSPQGEARFVQGLWVSGDFFSVFGVTPHLGRLLTSSDDRPGCGSPAAVLGHAFWRRQYGGEASAIGKSLMLDGHSFEIVGVAPQRFVGVEVGRAFDVATPLCAERILNPERSALDDPSWWWLTVIGRLAPGWSVERASSHLAAVSGEMFRNTVPPGLPPDVTSAYVASTLRAFPVPTGVSGTVREEYETPLAVLLAVAGVALLIASANIATLLLARATVREREIAVRLALGASRARIIRQLLTESVVLALAGAAAGMVLVRTLSEALVGLLHSSGFQFFAVTFDLNPNWRVLLFATVVTLTTCLLFGLAPAVLATRSPNGALVGAMTRTSTHARSRAGARSGLVVVQVALALVLVVTALLFVRTLHNLSTADSGFDPDGVAILLVDYQRARVPAERRLGLQAQLLDAVRAVPGVQGAAIVRMVPLTGESWTGPVVVGGVQHPTQAYFNRVSPAFFQTMRTAFVAGRDFTGDDSAGSRRVAIVNESFARELLGVADPIGSTFQMPARPGTRLPAFEVVGLVKDAKHTDLRAPFEPIAYFPVWQESRPLEYVSFVVRTASPSIAVTRSLTDAVSRIEPAAVVLMQSFRAQISDSLIRERLMAMLSGCFGAVAALLALLGLYGVVTYGVTQRGREIGIRMALGAQRSEVLTLVLGQSARLAIAGVALGLCAAAAATRYLEGMLFGLNPLDPGTFVLVSVAFLAVATVAAYVPARRATRLDPLDSLRCE